MSIGDDLRTKYNLSRPVRLPETGEIVEVDGKIGICTGYHKGYCKVRALSDDEPWLDFIADIERHGQDGKAWRIRDDL